MNELILPFGYDNKLELVPDGPYSMIYDGIIDALRTNITDIICVNSDNKIWVSCKYATTFNVRMYIDDKHNCVNIESFGVRGRSCDGKYWRKHATTSLSDKDMMDKIIKVLVPIYNEYR